jgi:hypothetical protein
MGNTALVRGRKETGPDGRRTGAGTPVRAELGSDRFGTTRHRSLTIHVCHVPLRRRKATVCVVRDPDLSMIGVLLDSCPLKDAGVARPRREDPVKPLTPQGDGYVTVRPLGNRRASCALAVQG